MIQSTISLSTLKDIVNQLDGIGGDMGFEFHAFHVGWYNTTVKPVFQLPYAEDTLAFVVVSIPSMFEKAFKPFLKIHGLSEASLRDPLDECMVHQFNIIQNAFANYGCKSIHDFELLPSRRPKILAQTAAHVSGAAYYYQRTDVNEQPWSATQQIFGVCIHPEFGGWFAIRGVLIFSLARCPGLLQRPAEDVVKTEEQRIKLLNQFNFHWQDWTYREVVVPKDRYSEEQVQYFSTKPSDRIHFLLNS